MDNPFVPAKKEKIFLRMALVGASGSGKTYTALTIGSQLAALSGSKIAFIDTEGRSARKYADKFTFDVLDLSKNFSPQEYIKAINAAVQNGYAVIIVDSFSHAWNGAGGVLDVADQSGKKMGGNDWAGWSKARPLQNLLNEIVLNAPIHIIGTMRSKTEWAIQVNPKTGKNEPVKVGLAPVQSADFEYEFDVVAYMDMQHTLNITKTRCSELDGLDNTQDMAFVSGTLHGWLTDGAMPENPMLSAKHILSTDNGKDDFRAFCTTLSIKSNGDSDPYLVALGGIKQFSEYAGLYEDMKQEMQTVYDALHLPEPPEPEPQADTEPVPDMSTEKAKELLGNGNSRRVVTAPVVPDQSPDAMPEVTTASTATFPPANGGSETLASPAAQSNGTPVVTTVNKLFNPSAAHQYQKPLDGMRTLNSAERKAAERDLEA